MHVIPALNCLDEESVKQRLAQASTFLPAGEWIHLDISDGKFTFTKTWNDPEQWQALAGQYNFSLEVHLMVEEPLAEVEKWLKAGAKRIIVHAETITPEGARAVTEACTQFKADGMLSSNPETPIEALRPYLREFVWFQTLAVLPGLSGQKFLPVVAEKIKLLRALRPNAKIEVDGGINPETARLAKEAGADAVVAASYIFWREDCADAYQELRAV